MSPNPFTSQWLAERQAKRARLFDKRDDSTPMLGSKPLGAGDKDSLTLLREIREKIVVKPKTRLRQPKPLLETKLEQDFFRILQGRNLFELRPKGIRLRLPGDVFYTPDFYARQLESGPLWLYEVKGPRKSKGRSKGEMTFKIAAGYWPIFKFVFVWKEDGRWHEQEYKEADTKL